MGPEAGVVVEVSCHLSFDGQAGQAGPSDCKDCGSQFNTNRYTYCF